MKKYLVVGNPIEHSLSPKLQNYWLNLNNIDAIYGKLLAYDDDLKELCNSIKNGQLDGLNITVPFKKKIIPYLDVLNGHALRTQSVNTISVKEGKLIGDNTDIDGTLEADAITVNGTALATVIADEATALAIALG